MEEEINGCNHQEEENDETQKEQLESMLAAAKIGLFQKEEGINLFTQVTIDISKSLQEKGLPEDRESQLCKIIEFLPFGIVLIDRDTHIIVDANPAALRITGTDRQEIIGAVCYQYICPRENNQCPITDLGKNADSAECLIKKANGEHVAILKTVLPIRLNNHEYLLESFFEITESMQIKEDPIKAKGNVAEMSWAELNILDKILVS
ncbi:MAG: PAS domain-containing protein [bacterium]